MRIFLRNMVASLSVGLAIAVVFFGYQAIADGGHFK